MYQDPKYHVYVFLRHYKIANKSRLILMIPGFFGSEMNGILYGTLAMEYSIGDDTKHNQKHHENPHHTNMANRHTQHQPSTHLSASIHHLSFNSLSRYIVQRRLTSKRFTHPSPCARHSQCSIISQVRFVLRRAHHPSWASFLTPSSSIAPPPPWFTIASLWMLSSITTRPLSVAIEVPDRP